MDLSKFKKLHVKGDKAVYVHPDGHEMHIKMPQTLADGGEVYDPTSIPNAAAANPPPDLVPPSLNENPHGVLSALDGEASGMPQAASAPQDPYGYSAMQQNLMQGYNAQTAGIQAEANAQGAKGDAEAQAYHNQAAGEYNAQQVYQKQYDNLVKEREGFISDIKNQHIDPNRYVDSMSGSKRAMTGIGLILSGMGAGVTHQQNLASEFLQSNINRDIEAQKANLGKSENLLSANMRQFGNLHDATLMTHSMMNDMYSAKIHEAASRSASPLAQAIAQREIGQLQMQNAGIFQQIAMRKAMLENPNAGPEQKIEALISNPQEKAKAMEELGKADDLGKQRDVILGLFDKATKENTVLKTGAGMLRTPASVLGLQVAVMPYLKDSAGRINEQELARVDGIIPRPGDSEAKVAEKKKAWVDFMSEKSATPLLNTYGIKPRGGKFTQQGARTIQLGPVK